jgi:D-beta-D-heptose 7-phosphate kinase/D-beta-D-heptose 1-phosphate adenosyltransferase
MSHPLHPREKILSPAELIARFGRPRNQTVVFTNGCFDLLHRGHVEYLYTARNLGDALILGLNTDASVRRLKGPARPVVPEGDRQAVIAALGCVDAVTLFDEDTPRALIAALLPDILVKGGDYRPESVVGKAEVEAAGGKVMIIPFLEGRSTTGLIQKLQEQER